MEDEYTAVAETEAEANESKPEQDQDTAVENQVTMWQGRVEKAKEHWGETFDRMKEDMKFARGIQWPGQTKPQDENDRYVVNIVHRHLRQREAALYAKNPTAVAKRRETLDFTRWNGDMQQIQQAQQTLMMIQQAQTMGQQVPPVMLKQADDAQLLLQDYQVGSQYREKVNKMARTLEIVWEHQIGEQIPPFKRNMKQLVRRVLTTSVGFLKLGYHRFNESRPEDVDRVNDLTEQLASLEAAMAEMKNDDSAYDETSAEAAEIRDLMQKVTQDQTTFMREGLDFDYPRSTSIIVDPACYALEGFVGARWVAQEYMLTPKQIREIYGVDITNGGYTPHDSEGKGISKEAFDKLKPAEKDCQNALVWEVWDKHLRQTFTLCAGHDKHLVKPRTPLVNLERFWPFFVLMFNGVEDEENIYPPSDVELLRQVQVERNLMRQRIREHRDAARPGHVVPKGRMDEEDKSSLQNRKAHDVIELNGLAEQDDIRRVLQAIPTSPIDPNQYETSTLEDDMYKAVGTQEAVVGGTSGASATETSIGESARLTSIGSNVDDLDDFLTEITRSSSQLLLVEMSPDLAQEIAGRGAVWPEFSGDDISRDLWLEIRAGSSGRPNKSAEIQNLERVMPMLLQIPGVKPRKLAELVIERLDDRIDIDELIDMNLPSIMAQNRMDQLPANDPDMQQDQQGVQGRDQTAVQEGDSNLGPRPPQEGRVMDPNRAQ